MRSYVMSLIMVMFCWPAHAGLNVLLETREGILYVDKDSAEKQGSILRVMSTHDFHRLQKLHGQEYLSAKAWYEVDCTEKKIRQVSLEIFPENMAMGGALHKDTEVQPWATPESGTRNGIIWKGICT
jgi:hypothetical protein